MRNSIRTYYRQECLRCGPAALPALERMGIFQLFGYNRREVRQISTKKNFSKNFVAIGKKRNSGAHILWGNLLHEVMSMEKSNPYSFYVVLADGIMEIPQESNLSWITLFYALPKELVEKRPAYLELPRNIHQLLHSEEYRKEIYEQRTIGNHALCDGCQAASTACLTFCGVTSPAVSDCSVFRYCTAARPRSFIVFPLSSR